MPHHLIRATTGLAAAALTIAGLIACSPGGEAAPGSPETTVTLPGGPGTEPQPPSAPASTGPSSSAPRQERDLRSTQVAVTWQEAIEAAQAEFDGEPTSVKLGWQRDGLRYTVELVSDTEEYEAKVDPESGQVVREDREPLDDDRDEAREDIFDPADVVEVATAMDAAVAEVEGPVTEWDLEGSERGVYFTFDIDNDNDRDDDVEVIVDAETGEFVRIDD